MKIFIGITVFALAFAIAQAAAFKIENPKDKISPKASWNANPSVLYNTIQVPTSGNANLKNTPQDLSFGGNTQANILANGKSAFGNINGGSILSNNQGINSVSNIPQILGGLSNQFPSTLQNVRNFT